MPNNDSITDKPTKQCYKCKRELPRNCFHKNRKRLDGLQQKCKSCAAEYRKENAERINKQIAQWREDNPER